MTSRALAYTLIFYLIVQAPLLVSQKRDNILLKKYPASALQSDLKLFKEVVFAMHPVIGIYEPKATTEKSFDQAIEGIKDSLTEKEFRILCKLLTDQLHCGHTEVLSSKAYQKRINKLKLNYSPYIFFPVQNKLYVIANLNKKKDSTMRKGVEVTKINGVETDSILRYCSRFISTDGYNTTAKAHYIQLAFNNFYPSLFGRPDTFEVNFKQGRLDKESRYAAIKVSSIPPIPLKAREDSLFKRYKRAAIKYRFLDSSDHSLLVKIEKFSNLAYKRAYRKLFKLAEKKNSANLVIDLRNNGGGSLANSYKLLTYLIDTIQTQTLSTRIKNYPYKKYTKGNLSFHFTRFVFSWIGRKETRGDTDRYVYSIKPGKKHHFKGGVVVLINGGSFSASALVGAYLKKRRNTIFIGEESGGAIEGCNAGITPYYTLPNTGLRIRIPAFRLQHDVSPKITGHGIIPDFVTVYSFKDIASRRDLDLVKLKEVIKNE